MFGGKGGGRLFLGPAGVRKVQKPHHEVVSAQMVSMLDDFLQTVESGYRGERVHADVRTDARIRASLTTPGAMCAVLCAIVAGCGDRSEGSTEAISKGTRHAVDALRAIGADTSCISAAATLVMEDAGMEPWARAAVARELLPHLLGGTIHQADAGLPRGQLVSWAGDRGNIQLPMDSPGDARDIPEHLEFVPLKGCSQAGYWRDARGNSTAMLIIADPDIGVVHVVCVSPSAQAITCTPAGLFRALEAIAPPVQPAQ